MFPFLATLAPPC